MIIIGQESIKHQIEVATHQKELAPHMLFCGPSGSGKTTMARYAAEKTGQEYFEIAKPSLIPDISRDHPNCVFFLDEIHLIKDTPDLLIMMSEFKYNNNGFIEKLNPFSLFAATTDEAQLMGPLRNRFVYQFNIKPYSEGELTQLVKLVLFANDYKISDEQAVLITKIGKGVPRTIKHLSSQLIDYAKFTGSSEINEDTLNLFLDSHDIHPSGLNELDIRYLRTIRAGARSEKMIADALGISRNNLRLIEPFLLKEGYIRITIRGRELTPRGGQLIEN